MTNVAFEIVAIADVNGDWEIVDVECEPTEEGTDDGLEAREVTADSWEFRFILPADFDGSEAMFRRLER
jgi:hypothetical protein